VTEAETLNREPPKAGGAPESRPEAPDPGPEGLRRAARLREADVRQAADALLLEGGRPTVERVRARLGRGSPNTVALFLDRWWRDLGARLRDLPGQELPSVPEPVAQALLALWSQAIDEARGLLKDSLGEREAELQQRHSALEARAADLERASEELARERVALEQTVTIAQQQLAESNGKRVAEAHGISLGVPRSCATVGSCRSLTRIGGA
jgi:transposase-like protein